MSPSGLSLNGFDHKLEAYATHKLETYATYPSGSTNH